jgi:hypothetical protein
MSPPAASVTGVFRGHLALFPTSNPGEQFAVSTTTDERIDS